MSRLKEQVCERKILGCHMIKSRLLGGRHDTATRPCWRRRCGGHSTSSGNLHPFWRVYKYALIMGLYRLYDDWISGPRNLRYSAEFNLSLFELVGFQSKLFKDLWYMDFPAVKVFSMFFLSSLDLCSAYCEHYPNFWHILVRPWKWDLKISFLLC